MRDGAEREKNYLGQCGENQSQNIEPQKKTKCLKPTHLYPERATIESRFLRESMFCLYKLPDQSIKPSLSSYGS